MYLTGFYPHMIASKLKNGNQKYKISISLLNLKTAIS